MIERPVEAALAGRNIEMRSVNKEANSLRSDALADDKLENVELRQLLQLVISCTEKFLAGLKEIKKSCGAAKQAEQSISQSSCPSHENTANFRSLGRQAKPDPRVWKIIDTNPSNLESSS